MVGYGLFI